MAGEKKERPVMVDMEQSLIDDTSGAYRRELINKLNGYEGDINRLIGAGVDSEHFEVYDKMKKAIKQAITVIEKFR